MSSKDQAYMDKLILKLAQEGKNKSVVTSLAIARALSVFDDIPNCVVDDLNSWFGIHNRERSINLIEGVNRMIPVSVSDIVEFQFAFFKNRYNQYHMDHDHPLCVYGNRDPIAEFFRVTDSFDKTTLDVIKTSCEEIADMSREFSSYFKSLLPDSKPIMTVGGESTTMKRTYLNV